MKDLVEGAIDVAGCGWRKILRGDAEGALDIVEVTAAHGLWPANKLGISICYIHKGYILSLYWGRKYSLPWVAWNWVINLCFVHLLQAGERKLIRQFPATHGK